MDDGMVICRANERLVNLRTLYQCVHYRRIAQVIKQTAPAIHTGIIPGKLTVGFTTPSFRRNDPDADIRHYLHTNLRYNALVY